MEKVYDLLDFGKPYTWATSTFDKWQPDRLIILLRTTLAIDETVSRDHALIVFEPESSTPSPYLPLRLRASDPFPFVSMSEMRRQNLGHKLTDLASRNEAISARILAWAAEMSPEPRAPLCARLHASLNWRHLERSIFSLRLSDDRRLELLSWGLAGSRSDCARGPHDPGANPFNPGLEERLSGWLPLVNSTYERFSDEVPAFLADAKAAILQGCRAKPAA